MPELSLKRMVDVTLATTVLVVTAPLLAIVSAAIRLDSPGPVLFRQLRVGRDRKPIETLKLRTMTFDTDRAGPQITAGTDWRITRVGKWLRKTKLDELPQLWNVIRGDMSLVGPRPEVPRYVARYHPEWNKLFTVRPGLTDLASLTFRNEESLLAGARDHERAYQEVIMPLKLRLALESVERSSLRYDLEIMAKTALAILRGHALENEDILTEAQRRIEQLNRTAEDE